MRLVSFEVGGAQRYGVEIGGEFVDLAASLREAGLAEERPLPLTMVQFLEAGEWGMTRIPHLVQLARSRQRATGGEKLVFGPSEVKLLAPIPRPPQAFGIGRNYGDHAAEVKNSVPSLPKLSLKVTNTVIGPGAAIVHPAQARFLDYEAELGVVIGRLACNVSREEALDYVAGYSIINDMGVKDIQSKDSQTILGKNFRTFTPLGPAIVTKDEIPDPQEIRIRLWVNGELRQDGNTRDMIYDVRTIVSFISHVCDLEPGAIIHTGSPAGVGWAMTPPKFLVPGDVVRIEMSGIGVLDNSIVASGVDVESLRGSGVNWPSLEGDLAVPVPGGSSR